MILHFDVAFTLMESIYIKSHIIHNHNQTFLNQDDVLASDRERERYFQNHHLHRFLKNLYKDNGIIL